MPLSSSCLSLGSKTVKDDYFDIAISKAHGDTYFKYPSKTWPFKNGREIDLVKSHGYFYEPGKYCLQNSTIATSLVAEKRPMQPFAADNNLVQMKVFGKARGSLLDAEYISHFSKHIDHVNMVVPRMVIHTKENNVALISDFCQGIQIDKFMRQNGHRANVAKPLFQQLVSCFNYCQSRKILHFNLTTASIYVKDGAMPLVQITDFGIPVMNDIRRLENTFGKSARFSYEAPEVLCEVSNENKTAATTEKSNIYSLGVILYQMLTGDLPYTGSKTQVQGKSNNKVLNYATNVSPKVKDLIGKMLHPQAFYRPSAKTCLEHSWLGGVVETTLKETASPIKTDLDNLWQEYSDRRTRRQCGLPLAPWSDENVIAMPKEPKIRSFGTGTGPLLGTKEAGTQTEFNPMIRECHTCQGAQTTESEKLVKSDFNTERYTAQKQRREYLKQQHNRPFSSDIEHTQVWCGQRNALLPKSEEVVQEPYKDEQQGKLPKSEEIMPNSYKDAEMETGVNVRRRKMTRLQEMVKASRREQYQYNTSPEPVNDIQETKYLPTDLQDMSVDTIQYQAAVAYQNMQNLAPHETKIRHYTQEEKDFAELMLIQTARSQPALISSCPTYPHKHMERSSACQGSVNYIRDWICHVPPSPDPVILPAPIEPCNETDDSSDDSSYIEPIAIYGSNNKSEQQKKRFPQNVKQEQFISASSEETSQRNTTVGAKKGYSTGKQRKKPKQAWTIETKKEEDIRNRTQVTTGDIEKKNKAYKYTESTMRKVKEMDLTSYDAQENLILTSKAENEKKEEVVADLVQTINIGARRRPRKSMKGDSDSVSTVKDDSQVMKLLSATTTPNKYLASMDKARKEGTEMLKHIQPANVTARRRPRKMKNHDFKEKLATPQNTSESSEHLPGVTPEEKPAVETKQNKVVKEDKLNDSENTLAAKENFEIDDSSMNSGSSSEEETSQDIPSSNEDEEESPGTASDSHSSNKTMKSEKAIQRSQSGQVMKSLSATTTDTRTIDMSYSEGHIENDETVKPEEAIQKSQSEELMKSLSATTTDTTKSDMDDSDRGREKVEDTNQVVKKENSYIEQSKKAEKKMMKLENAARKAEKKKERVEKKEAKKLQMKQKWQLKKEAKLQKKMEKKKLKAGSENEPKRECHEEENRILNDGLLNEKDEPETKDEHADDNGQTDKPPSKQKEKKKKESKKEERAKIKEKKEAKKEEKRAKKTAAKQEKKEKKEEASAKQEKERKEAKKEMKAVKVAAKQEKKEKKQTKKEEKIAAKQEKKEKKAEGKKDKKQNKKQAKAEKKHAKKEQKKKAKKSNGEMDEINDQPQKTEEVVTEPEKNGIETVVKPEFEKKDEEQMDKNHAVDNSADDRISKQDANEKEPQSGQNTARIIMVTSAISTDDESESNSSEENEPITKPVTENQEKLKSSLNGPSIIMVKSANRMDDEGTGELEVDANEKEPEPGQKPSRIIMVKSANNTDDENEDFGEENEPAMKPAEEIKSAEKNDSKSDNGNTEAKEDLANRFEAEGRDGKQSNTDQVQDDKHKQEIEHETVKEIEPKDELATIMQRDLPSTPTVTHQKLAKKEKKSFWSKKKGPSSKTDRSVAKLEAKQAKETKKEAKKEKKQMKLQKKAEKKEAKKSKKGTQRMEAAIKPVTAVDRMREAEKESMELASMVNACLQEAKPVRDESPQPSPRPVIPGENPLLDNVLANYKAKCAIEYDRTPVMAFVPDDSDSSAKPDVNSTAAGKPLDNSPKKASIAWI